MIDERLVVGRPYTAGASLEVIECDLSESALYTHLHFSVCSKSSSEGTSLRALSVVDLCASPERSFCKVKLELGRLGESCSSIRQ